MEEVTFMRGPGERVMSLENIDAYAVEAQKIYASFGITLSLIHIYMGGTCPCQ